MPGRSWREIRSYIDTVNIPILINFCPPHALDLCEDTTYRSLIYMTCTAYTNISGSVWHGSRANVYRVGYVLYQSVPKYNLCLD